VENYSENKNHATSAVFPVILLSILFLIFSGSSKSNLPDSQRYSHRNEILSVLIPKHSEAVIFADKSIPEPLDNFSDGLRYTDLQIFSIQHHSRVYDHKIFLDFINIQNVEVETTPLLLWRLYNPSSSGDRDVLPVLS
jgi:hypothetical protein